MALRYVHYIAQSSLESFRVSGSRLILSARFAGDEAGAAAFSEWLASARRGIHTVLVDVAEEGFQTELIPYVPGPDRRALIARKLSQMFFGSPFSAAISVGREKSGRRDERIVFAALTRPSAIEPWIKALRQNEAAVAAIYSVPLLANRLIEGLRLHHPRGLTVTFTRGGIRQTYFEDGQLRFSRLSPAPEGQMSTWGAACLRETQKTWQYLSAQRWIPRNEILPAWLILDQPDFAPVLAELETAESIAFKPANLDTLCRHFNVGRDARDSDSQNLMMTLSLLASSGPQLAPKTDRQLFLLWRLRTAITAIGLIAGASLGIWALKNYIDARTLAEQTLQDRQSLVEVDQRYRALLATLPAMPTSLETLQEVVARVDALTTSGGSPTEALEPLSRALERHPQIQVRRITWQHDTQASAPANGSGARFSTTLDASLPADAAADPQSALAAIQAFAVDVRRESSGGEVILPKMPFDAEPGKTMRSETALSQRAPEFQLRLTTTRGGGK